MSRTYTEHLDSDPLAPIICERGNSKILYPVLEIGGSTFFPSRYQLVRIHDAIGTWLTNNPRPLEVLNEHQEPLPPEAIEAGVLQPDF